MSQRRLAASESTHDSNGIDEERDIQDNVPRRMSWPNRNFIGFWLLGLCNNFAYVIMLSAAKDILESGTGSKLSSNTTEAFCRSSVINRNCHPMSTGSVLLADILPALCVKVTAPFYIHMFPFGLRHLVVVLLQAISFLIVATSNDVVTGLTGVSLASFGSGLGEITYLSLGTHFSVRSVSFWSSGTGGAGIFGALAYALMTDKTLLSISPRHTLLSMLTIPILFACTFWWILRLPSTVHRVKLTDLRTYLIPEDSRWREAHHSEDATSPLLSSNQRSRPSCRVETVSPLFKYIVPLVLVYFGEYFINQGLVELLEFDCSHGLNLDPASQYRWYQVLYQLGVFVSRSSSDCVAIPSTLLPLLAILQIINAMLFLIDAIEYFLPHILLVFCLIFYEGLLGGSAYVNTFRAIHDEVPADRREFSMCVVSISDTLGIVFSGFLAIPVHNWICSKPL